MIKMHTRSFNLLCVFFMLIAVNIGASDGRIRCIDSERRALLNIRDDLIDNYGRLSSWGSEDRKKDCCKWRGIQCSNRTGHVNMLDLHVTELGDGHKPLRGKISHSLLELPHLNYLDLSCNDFRRTLFPSLNGSLRKLRYLNISSAGFSGKLSYQLRNLSSLQSLDLSNNFFSVETIGWLSDLSHLQVLDLSGNSLGKVVDWLHIVNNLPYLTSLHLRSCDLANTIPQSNPYTNSSSSLSILDLSHNKLEGRIPNIFGNFCSLHTLDLSSNNLTGQLPVFFEHLPRCAENSLEILKLEENQLHGSLPDFTRFSSLKELIVYDNQLNGSFPQRFSNLSALVDLDVGGNQLVGSLPDLTMFPSLKKLCVVYNRLNGTIGESIGGLSQLEFLWVSHNAFQGVISEGHFLNLSRLRQVYFNNNPLAFKFNSNWLPPFQLDIIGFMSCNLGPHFPKWLRTQNNYSVLDLSDAGISAPVPEWFWNLSSRLFHLNISNNLLSGVIPDLSLKFDGNPGIDLSSNIFEGPLPLLPSNASSLNLSKNKFLGSISSVCNFIGGTLGFIDLSDNLLSGILPDDCFKKGQRLVIINLADNNLSGNIPTSVGSLSMLQTFSLHNNSFSGEIPLSLRNCSWLRFLDLSYNKLSGKIPAAIGELPLVFLSLQSNQFNGSIPIQLCQLQNILMLDLSLNDISGTIPQCLENFTSMARKRLENNNIYNYRFLSSSSRGNIFEGRYANEALIGWKGSAYTFDKNLRLLRIINLAGNKLSGEIPVQITGLVKLGGLNLSKNDLTGMIPQETGQLKQLQWLDLSRNRLSGVIPSSMAELHFLSVLDLAYNNLSGRIPTSTQLQSFDASSFAGNVELCGLPIKRKCPGDDMTQVEPTNDDTQENEEHEDEFMKWFSVGLGSGFSIGFCGVLGILLLRPSFRHAFFLFMDKAKNWLYCNSN